MKSPEKNTRNCAYKEKLKQKPGHCKQIFILWLQTKLLKHTHLQRTAQQKHKTKELQVNFYTMVANQIVKIYPHTKELQVNFKLLKYTHILNA